MVCVRVYESVTESARHLPRINANKARVIQRNDTLTNKTGRVDVRRYGGAMHNFYMLTGGNNYGKCAKVG